MLSEGVSAHHSEGSLGLFVGDGECELSFVGEVDRVESKDLTKALYFGADGDLCGVDGDV